MDVSLTDGELDEIERRAMLATPGPWQARLETRWGTGGASCIDLDPDGEDDAELYFQYSPQARVSPDQGPGR